MLYSLSYCRNWLFLLLCLYKTEFKIFQVHLDLLDYSQTSNKRLILRCGAYSRTVFEELGNVKILSHQEKTTSRSIQGYIPFAIYLSKINNGNTTVICEICSKLAIKHQNDADEKYIIHYLFALYFKLTYIIELKITMPSSDMLIQIKFLH